MSNDGETLQFPHVRYTDSGKLIVLNTASNLKALLEYAGYEAKHNKMTLEQDIYSGQECIGTPEVIRSELISLASIHSLPRASIDDHFAAVALENSYHPIEEWLNDSWDGKKRVDKAISCLRAKNNGLASVVMKRWLVGCVASLYVPNFKSKLVPVLQGEQSFRKTAFVERIATVMNGAFLEGSELNPDNKDNVLSVIRSWIVELGELERSTRNCQGALKAFITRSCDTIRPPYARTDIKKPRQTNLIATVNGTDFLKDETGNSRYAVIELVKETDMSLLNEVLGWRFSRSGELVLINPERLKQFWLEVKHLLLNEGYAWTLTRDEQRLIAEDSEKYVDKGVWYNMLSEHINVCEDKAREWMTTKQICEFIGINVSRGNAVGKALSLLSKEGKIERKLLNGTNRYCFPTVTPLESL